MAGAVALGLWFLLNTTQTRVGNLFFSSPQGGMVHVYLFEWFHLFQAVRGTYLRYAKHLMPAFHSTLCGIFCCSVCICFEAAGTAESLTGMLFP